jgi:hypothetical protein
MVVHRLCMQAHVLHSRITHKAWGQKRVCLQFQSGFSMTKSLGSILFLP